MPIIGLIIILVCFIGGGYWLVWEDRRYHARLGGTASEAPKPADRSAQDILAELRATLAVREETIRDLREKGGRLVVDRDPMGGGSQKARKRNRQSERRSRGGRSSTRQRLEQIP